MSGRARFVGETVAVVAADTQDIAQQALELIRVRWDVHTSYPDMYDVGTQMGLPKSRIRVGVEYQYWKNKFGNPSTVPGSLASTPMVRVEVHF